MKLYAQIGHGLGDKVSQGLSEALLDGAIFSPKDLRKTSLVDRITELRLEYPEADVIIDPQFYVSTSADLPTTNAGNVTDWNYFKAYRKSDLELWPTVTHILTEYYEEITALEVTGIIAPNIFISQSFDSREAVIAKNFIRQAREVYDEIDDPRPLYASLIICREAMQDQREFDEFLNDISLLDNPPDGFYIIIAGRSSTARTEIFHTDVLANWMLLNQSLYINGFQVINGYSDIVTPFLGAVGASAGATGWWSNLRRFSMERFSTAVTGGRQPIYRYLSKDLLNRITFNEKEALEHFVDDIINNLPHDVDYQPEPENRTQEILQAWEALKSLNDELVSEEITEGLNNCILAIERAQTTYARIAETGLLLDRKSQNDHLEALAEAIPQFKKKAQL